MDIVDDICAFAKKYLDIIYPPHQKRWLASWEQHSMNLTLGPREHGKSTTDTTYVLYHICHDPDLRVLIASHKEEQADTFARFITMNLERPDIQADFPGIVPGKPWKVGKAFFEGKKHPVLRTVAKQAGMTGGRFDWVVFDDLLTVENVATEKMRQRLERWIGAEVFPSIDHTPKRKILVVGTRKHVKDWYGKLLKSPQFLTTVDQLYTIDGEGAKHYLWPERFNEQAEAEARTFMSPELFAQEYMNSPVADEGRYLRREWLKWYDELPPQHCLRVYMGVDPSAGSELERASSLAVAVIAEDIRSEFRRIYVLELFKQKMPLAKQFEMIRILHDKYHPVSTNIEGVLINSEFAKFIIDRIPNCQIIDYIHSRLRGTSEKSKELRIKNYIGLYLEEGRVVFRNPDVDYQTREFIETEYILFPDKDAATDLLDALTLAVDLVDVIPRMDQPPMFAWS